MSQNNGLTTLTFRVADLANYTDSLKKLASLNSDWKLSPEEILDSGKVDQKIFKLKFTNRPVQLKPDEFSGDSISVIVAGYQIGTIRKEDAPQVNSILNGCDIRSISCGIWGGQSKVVDEYGNVKTQNQGVSVTVRIAYSDLAALSDDDLNFDVEDPKSAKKVTKKNKKKKVKKPFFKRWWFWVIVIVLLLGSCGDTEGTATEPTSTETTTSVAEPTETELTTPAVTETVAVITTEAEPVVADNVSIGENNALRSAQSYLNFTAFSYTGLIEQLEFEGYTADEAKYAVDNCGADWKEQALKSAKNYLDFTAFSYSGLIDQLGFEGYTKEEATYGADNCGADWFEQAAKSAKNYLDFSSFSRSGLIDQLVFEGFTTEQATYGAEQNGY